MSTAPRTEVLLGCDPQVRVVIIEDAGNLVLQVFSEDPAVTDIDALFFNLADGVDASNLTIFPGYDEAIGSNGENVTGYDVATGSLNQMNNGAQIQDSYDVRLEFGTVPYTTGGDVDQAALTFYVDGGASNLTADSFDLSNMTAVINSDSGNGLALTGGSSSGDSFDASIYAAERAGAESSLELTNDTDDSYTLSWINYAGEVVDYQTIDPGETAHQGTYVQHNWILTNNTTGEVTYIGSAGRDGREFDISEAVPGNDFDPSIYASVGAGRHTTLELNNDTDDTFTLSWINYHGDVVDYQTIEPGETAHQGTYAQHNWLLTNNDTGEVTYIGATGYNGRSFDISDTQYDNVMMEQTVVASEDFDGITNATDADLVAWNEGWQITNGEAEANGCNDGNLWFQSVAVNGNTEISFDARAPHTEYFENGGCYGDSLEVWALVDGNSWALLDTFTVNHDGTALVGDTTGQTITADSQTLSYSGGALENAQSVQLVLDADISASNEEIFVDNVEIATLEEVPVDGHSSNETCEDFESANAGDVVSNQFDGFTVTAQKAGDVRVNDAMIFDTDNPTGGDHDLEYNDQGNALIISEDNDSSDPDDNAGGGTFTFEFDDPSTVTSLTLLDIEEAGGTIDLFDVDGVLLNSVAIPAAGDNSAQDIDIDTDGVSTMNVNLVGSGAVDDLCYIAPEDNCGQYDVTYDSLFNQPITNDDNMSDDTTDDVMADMMV